MKILSEKEIIGFIQDGRKLSEEAGTAILDQFEKDQPEMYQAIFGELSDGIASDSEDMSNLFLDLCFDIILVYKMAFGDPPIKIRNKDWFNNKVALLDAELKSLDSESSMSNKLKQQLSNRFIKRSAEAGIQLALLEHFDQEVRKYASFDVSRMTAIHVTNNLIFVVVRLMDDIYSTA